MYFCKCALHPTSLTYQLAVTGNGEQQNQP